MKPSTAILSVVLAAFSVALLALPLQDGGNAKVVRVDAASGTVLARDMKTGRTFQFTLASDVAGALKAGQSVTANLGEMRVTAVNGAPRQAQVKDPDSFSPCCAVVAFATDSGALEAMLRGLTGVQPSGATGAGNPAADGTSALKSLLREIANAQPPGAQQIDFRSLLRTVEPVNGIVDPAQPVGGVLLIHDRASQAHHVVLVSGAQPPGALAAMLASGDVAVDERSGLALFRTNGQTFSHPLYRPGTTATATGPWELIPDASLRGTVGRLVTNFPEKTGGTNRMVTIYNPGTTDQVSYKGTGTPHEVPEGSYDVKVNDVTVKGVPIVRGQVTRLFVGTVTFAAGGSTRHSIFDASGKTELFRMNGYEFIGLPAGSYSIKAGARVVPFEVKDGQLTEL